MPRKRAVKSRKQRSCRFDVITRDQFVKCKKKNWTQTTKALGFDPRDSPKLKRYILSKDWWTDDLEPVKGPVKEWTSKFSSVTLQDYLLHAGQYQLAEFAVKMGFHESQHWGLVNYIRKQGWDKLIEPALFQQQKRELRSAFIVTDPVNEVEDGEENQLVFEENFLPEDLDVDVPERPVELWGISFEAETHETEESSSDETQATQETEESSSDGSMTTQVNVDDFFLP